MMMSELTNPQSNTYLLKFKLVFIFLFFTFMSAEVNAQSPGGVSGVTFWFVPDSAKNAESGGVLPTEGEKVYRWNDKSGYGADAYDYSQRETDLGYGFPTYHLNQIINGHGVLRFSGNEYLPIDSIVEVDADLDSMTMFAIVRPSTNSLTSDAYILSGDRSDYWTLLINSSNRIKLEAGGRKNNGSKAEITNNIGQSLSSSEFHLIAANAGYFNDGQTKLRTRVFYNGKEPDSVTNSNSSYSQAHFGGSDDRIFNIGVGSDNGVHPPATSSDINKPNFFNGDIAEIIVYFDQVLDTLELNKVWTYLSLKYSIMLETQNHFASDGTQVWDRDTTNSKPYHHDVIGVFNESTNNDGLEHLASADADSLLIISANSLVDKYIVMGHNSGGYDTLEGTFGEANFAVNKIWKYQITDVSACPIICANTAFIDELSFDISGLVDAPTGSAENFYLLMDSDENFSTNLQYQQASTLLGNTLTFENFTLKDPSNGSGINYFRLAYLLDTDRDGIGDHLDEDNDNDGISDEAEGEGLRDTDSDGITDDLDLDSDGDGIPDLWEANDAIRALDTDQDGYISESELFDNDTDADGWHDTAESNDGLDNSDDDSVKDYLDLDSDNDGISDLIEGRNFYSLDNGDDGTESGIDQDQDGIYDDFDDNSSVFGNGDAINLNDTDIDGIYNFQETRSDGANADSDGADYHSEDIDKDTFILNDPTDSDGDGIADLVDTSSSFGGLPGSISDWDADGVNNTFDWDVDNDGILEESDSDTDGDGAKDSRDLDSDNDGIFDIIESGNSAALAKDIDGDGMVDSIDDLVKGINNSADSIVVHTDSTSTYLDAIPDYLDLDSDNDGLSDALERGHITGGKLNPGKADRGFFGTADIDTDGIPDGIDSDLAAKGSSYASPNAAYKTEDPSANTTFGYSFAGIDEDEDGIDDGVDEHVNTDPEVNSWGGLPTYYQLAPAGVSKDLQLWIRASDAYEDAAGTDPVEDGDAVLYLDDSSPNLRYGQQTASTTSIEPPTVVKEAINYNEALSFDGNNDQIPLDFSFDYANDTIGFVFITAVVQVPENLGGSNEDEKVLFSMDFRSYFHCGIENRSGDWNLAWKTSSPNNTNKDSWGTTKIDDGEPHIVSFVYTLTPPEEGEGDSTDIKNIYLDGILEAQREGDHKGRLGKVGATRFANLGADFNSSEFAGDTSPSNPFQGYLTELMMHRDMDEDEQRKIVSYLAIKYGVTLSSGYYSQANEELWSESGDDAIYADKIIGLGRITSSEFNQSKSGDDTLTFWTGTTSSELDITEDHYYFMGRNTGNPANIATDVPSGYEMRSSRVYKFKGVTNDGTLLNTTGNEPGDIALKMGLKGIETGLVGEAATADEVRDNLVLLINNSTNFSTVLKEITPSIAETTDSEVYFNIANGDIQSGHYFTLASRKSTPLPLDWRSFEASREEENVILQWKTANEENVSHFEIERSLNTLDFEKVGEVKATNASGPNTYDFKDFDQNQAAYYRIKEVDYDGFIDYSKTIRVDGFRKTELVVYPNPSNLNAFTYEIDLIPNERAYVILKDVLGRVIQKELVGSQDGYIRKNLHHSSKGMFFLEVETRYQSWTRKIILK